MRPNPRKVIHRPFGALALGVFPSQEHLGRFMRFRIRWRPIVDAGGYGGGTAGV